MYDQGIRTSIKKLRLKRLNFHLLILMAKLIKLNKYKQILHC